MIFFQVGFRLSNGVYCAGPIALFSRSVLSWDVEGPYDITPESLSLFTRLEPKLGKRRHVVQMKVPKPGSAMGA